MNLDTCVHVFVVSSNQHVEKAGEGHFTGLGGAECCVICAKISSATSASFLRGPGHMHAVHKLMSMQALFLHRDPRKHVSSAQVESFEEQSREAQWQRAGRLLRSGIRSCTAVK